MKNRGILGLIFFLSTACLGFGADVLERKIDVRFIQTPLKDALTEVANKGNFEWSYNAGILDGNQKISLIANSWTIREIIHALLGDQYQVKASGNYLIIKKAKKQPEQLRGYVKDPKTGAGIAGATVFDQKTLRAATTDSNGYYSLKVKKNAAVVVAKLDFRDTVLQVTSQTPRFMNIPLVEIQRDSTPNPKVDLAAELKAELEEFQTEFRRFFRATREKLHTLNVGDSLNRKWQVSFLPKVGTNHVLSGQVVNGYSLNIIAGYSKGVDILEIGGIGNFTESYVNGAQVSGVFNINMGNTQGVAVAGTYNHNRDSLTGGQISGFANYTNYADNGIQVAGFVNYINDADNSIQVGGFGNISRSGTSAIQVGGTYNLADTVVGIQVAGIINRAKWVKGIQIGLINSAKDCNCIQIGLINKIGRRWLPFVNGR